MAWYPPAIKKNIPPGSSDPVIKPIGVIFHVRAGTGASLFPYFNGPSGGIESTGYIRFDGTMEQYRDTTREADANYHGNSFMLNGQLCGFLSLETEGLEHGEWTNAQIATMKDFTAWAAKLHGFPLRVCPAWNQPGVGYHVMFGAPGPWTPVSKSCPGPDRVRQFNKIIVPWLNSGSTSDTGGELFTVAQYEEIIKRLDYLKAQNLTNAESIAYVTEQCKTLGGLINDVPSAEETAVAVHGRWLGRSGPTIGTAIQSTYQWVKELREKAGLSTKDAEAPVEEGS